MTNPRPAAPGPTTTSTQWVDRLATLGHELRPDWDQPGIRSALTKVSDRPLRNVARALIEACERVDQRTPAVIALNGPHWHNTPPAAPDSTPTVPPAERCDVCDQPADVCTAQNARVAPEHRHNFTPKRARRTITGTRLTDVQQALSIENAL